MQSLGKYEIISEIGRGAMGAVYKARDPLINRLVALKTITGGPRAQADLLDRFYQEARSAGALQHPNIVTIYELGHEKNTPFIAMEFLEGESLDHLIEKRANLPLSVKLGYVVRVCEALSYAHQHNVIHRDVKPANIMVTKEGVVKVVDFGIARLADMSMTQPNMMIGSRAYMSPQLYKGEKADARADIWAVGVTLYELLTYRRAFTGDNEAELMFHIIYENPPALRDMTSDCSEELASIVSKMLEKKNEDRYQTMDEVLHALEPVWKEAQQSTVAGLLVDSRDLLAAKDLQRAQVLLRKALHIDVGNTQAKSLLEKVSQELRQTEIQPRLKEHLSRGEAFLKSGHIREARSEAEAALGLDSKYEPAKKLLADAEAAAARAQELEQKLRLAKQRLAEGALTEAATALGQALELDRANAQAQELMRQIEEEANRRERRKKLSQILHRARTLWTELNYEECLTVLAAAMQEFPNETELKKLQDTARADQAEQQKQRRMGEVRKLLGQQSFSEAQKILEELTKDYPQDRAIKNLQALAAQEEQQQKRQKRLEEEMRDLRDLLAGSKLRQVVAKGEALLLEYPQEYELKELVTYAREELSRLERRKKEEDREKQIRGLLDSERYAEALALAHRAIEEFPEQDIFVRLAAEARERKEEEEDREKARHEMQRRIREISSKSSPVNLTDPNDLAQQTLDTVGPAPHVAQSRQSAEQKSNKGEIEAKVSAVRSLVDQGDYAGATQLFNDVMATRILQPADPRAQELQARISALAGAQRKAEARPSPAKTTSPKPLPAPPEKSALENQTELMANMAAGSATSVQSTPASMFSATRVIGPESSPTRRDGSVTRHADSGSGDPGRLSSVSSPANSGTISRLPGHPLAATPEGLQKTERKPWALPQLPAVLRRPPVLAGLGAALLILIGLSAWALMRTGGRPSEKDSRLKQQAIQLWQDQQFDQSEQLWRQLAQTKGALRTEAIRQVNQIEQKRGEEQRRFDEGEGLLKDKQYAAAQPAFQEVINMSLWHSAEAARELEVAKRAVGEEDIHKQEKDHFDLGVQLFQNKDFEKSRREFEAARDVKVPNSVLRPQIDGFLKRIAQNGDAKKLYQLALEDIKKENWDGAQQQLQEVVNRKGELSGQAKQRLGDVAAAQRAEATFHQSLRTGTYRDAKSQLDGMQQWPKTRERLLKDLLSAERQEANDIQARANTLQANDDVNGLERLKEELHKFAGRVEDPNLARWATQEFDPWLNNAEQKLIGKRADKAAFDTAVAHFEQAKQKKDTGQLGHAVIQEFQKIANGQGAYREQAQIYVKSTIPNTIQELTQTKGKVSLPPILCGPGQASQTLPSIGGAVSCAQLDPGNPLQWLGTPLVNLPENAKLPYTLNLIVTVDPEGNIKIEKDGNAEKDFLKKAKDASKHWKTTVPKSGGKPVTVRFSYSITFR